MECDRATASFLPGWRRRRAIPTVQLAGEVPADDEVVTALIGNSFQPIHAVSAAGHPSQPSGT